MEVGTAAEGHGGREGNEGTVSRSHMHRATNTTSSTKSQNTE